MSESDAPLFEGTSAPAIELTTAPRRELTVRAVLTAIFVAVLIGSSYPYVVLKLGFGPNISVVSAFFGYLAISAIGFVTGVRGTRWENNLVQTAGTAAGQAGFMCTLLAAFDMLNQKTGLGFSVHLTRLQTFLWLSVAGALGVLLAVPLRKHFIDEENLTYADGTAAGATLLILDQDREEAGKRTKALGLGLFLSFAFAWFRDAMGKFNEHLTFSAAWFWGQYGQALRMGVDWSLLSFGSGLLVGMRISLSMAIGMMLSWVILPPILASNGLIAEQTFAVTLRWVMWPATGMMVAGGLTTLILKWRLIVRTFANLKRESVSSQGSDFPIRWVLIGSLVLGTLLCVIQHYSLGLPVWMTVVALLCSLPLMLVGTRVLGETNWAPISAMANMMQAVFAVLAPGNMVANMVASGMSGTVAANGEHLMQDYRAGKIVGSTNRNLTYLQLVGVPVGALAVAFVYPLLRDRYGIGGETGLSSPISVKWAGFAELLSGGIDKLPEGCFMAMLLAILLGAVIAIFETKYKHILPSPTGIGIGMLIPGFVMMPMIVGGFVQHAWQHLHPKNEDTYNTPFASGLIAGEAILAVILPLLIVVGVLSP